MSSDIQRPSYERLEVMHRMLAGIRAGRVYDEAALVVCAACQAALDAFA